MRALLVRDGDERGQEVEEVDDEQCLRLLVLVAEVAAPELLAVRVAVAPPHFADRRVDRLVGVLVRRVPLQQLEQHRYRIPRQSVLVLAEHFVQGAHDLRQIHPLLGEHEVLAQNLADLLRRKALSEGALLLLFHTSR